MSKHLVAAIPLLTIVLLHQPSHADDKIDIVFLKHTVSLWRAKDWDGLQSLASQEKRAAERTLAGYFYSLSERPDAEAVFFKGYARDFSEIWKLASSQTSWEGICRQDEHKQCHDGVDLDRLHMMALTGNREAIRVFIETWVSHSDTSLAELIANDFLPRLLIQRPIETAQVLEKVSKMEQDVFLTLTPSPRCNGDKRLRRSIKQIRAGVPRSKMRNRLLAALQGGGYCP